MGIKVTENLPDDEMVLQLYEYQAIGDDAEYRFYFESFHRLMSLLNAVIVVCRYEEISKYHRSYID
jgi:hypothetical protein